MGAAVARRSVPFAQHRSASAAFSLRPVTQSSDYTQTVTQLQGPVLLVARGVRKIVGVSKVSLISLELPFLSR